MRLCIEIDRDIIVSPVIYMCFIYNRKSMISDPSAHGYRITVDFHNDLFQIIESFDL